MRYRFFLFLVIGCADSPALDPHVQTCLGLVDAELLADEDRECYQRGYVWDECPWEPDLLRAYEARQRQCTDPPAKCKERSRCF